ncbi:sensor histidine kinase [Ancylobacter dichloromethanicus]
MPARCPASISDEQLVAVALHNLVDNALKYSPEGSTVEVTALIEENAPPDGRAAATPGIRVAVENSCGRTGVPDPARLFEKFHRGPQARTTSGSGLGLYIVQGITDLLGGSVSYQFSEGRARFSLWLPCSA